ncbi:MAG: hypothetical protein JM58_13065 [Peptococcaceae bacterium BICA1-8]|nr:MAG: hypothetical protein JM58_13065 [Peptococcaceae bacterium BICA1-8]
MFSIIVLLLLFVLVIWSVRSKIYINKKRQKDLPEPINSPVSQALTQLLGAAGGIYLSLVMLASFLGIDVPDKALFLQWAIDPLAFFSLVITLLQPLLMRVFQKN